MYFAWSFIGYNSVEPPSVTQEVVRTAFDFTNDIVLHVHIRL